MVVGFESIPVKASIGITCECFSSTFTIGSTCDSSHLFYNLTVSPPLSLQSKLALQKHLTKTLATRFLPSPLTAAAVCAMPGPLALRPAAATTLFQAPILGPALFRTPPAHVRPTPGPIVFAPY